MASGPFVDPVSNELDTSQIISEAIPIVGLVLLFATVAAVPFLLGAVFSFGSLLGLVFILIAQLVLVVGAGIVLIYVVARGIQLADDGADTRRTVEA